MSAITVVLICWIVAISVISIIVTVVDKYKAAHFKWRIKESTLLILAALGGSAAMYITMQLIRHKTRKLKFMLGIPLIFILQTGALVLCVLVKNNAIG